MFGCHSSTESAPKVAPESSLGKLCASKYLGCESFVIFFGVIGTLLTVTDIFWIMRGGMVLDEEIWRRRYSRGDAVNPLMKRDLKLISSVLGAEHYILLVLGSVFGRPTFLIPWLVLQGFVIIMQLLIFFLRLISGGVHLFKGEVIVYAFLVHNWMQVLCYFNNST